MAHVAELGLAPLCLPIELGFAIRRALMRVVLAHLTMKFEPSSPSLERFGLKLLCEAQASISVPSTEKCSSDKSGFTFA